MAAAEAMALARLVILAMAGMLAREVLVGDMDTLDTLDLLIHFSMWPLRTSLLLNFLPHSWQG